MGNSVSNIIKITFSVRSEGNATNLPLQNAGSVYIGKKSVSDKRVPRFRPDLFNEKMGKEKAIQCFQAAIFKGRNKEAAFQYGRGLRKGLYEYVDSRVTTLYFTAVILCQADQTLPEVQYNLARTYHLWALEPIPEDRAFMLSPSSILKMVELYQGLAEVGHCKSQYYLYEWFCNADNPDHNWELACHYLELAAQQNYPLALLDKSRLSAIRGGKEAIALFEKTLEFGKNKLNRARIWWCYHELIKLYIKDYRHNPSSLKMAMHYALEGYRLAPEQSTTTIAYCGKELNHYFDRLRREEDEVTCDMYLTSAVAAYASLVEAMASDKNDEEKVYLHFLRLKGEHLRMFTCEYGKNNENPILPILKRNQFIVTSLSRQKDEPYANFVLALHYFVNEPDREEALKHIHRYIKRQMHLKKPPILAYIYFSKCREIHYQIDDVETYWEENPQTVFFYYEHLAAYHRPYAIQGIAEHQFQLAKVLASHMSPHSNPDEALFYCQTAAEQNHPGALYLLATEFSKKAPNADRISLFERALQFSEDRLNQTQIQYIYFQLTRFYIQESSNNFAMLDIAMTYAFELSKLRFDRSVYLCGEALNDHFDFLRENGSQASYNRWLDRVIIVYQKLIQSLDQAKSHTIAELYLLLLVFKKSYTRKTEKKIISLLKELSNKDMCFLSSRENDAHANCLLAGYYFTHKEDDKVGEQYVRRMKKCAPDLYLFYTAGKFLIENNKNEMLGLKLLQKVAALDYFPALQYLTGLYWHGVKIQEDMHASLYFAEKACAHSKATCNHFYNAGVIALAIGGALYEDRAEYYMMRAIQKGHNAAKYDLGRMYLDHKGSARSEDKSEYALCLIRRAAEQGVEGAKDYLNAYERSDPIAAPGR